MQIIALNVIRILLGWHILFEGLTKLFTPNWSSRSYLMDSGGFLKPIFQSLAESEGILRIIDPLNVWLLIIVGLVLILGIKSNYAALTGGILLFLYYIAQPPFLGITYQIFSPGSTLIVTPLLIEIGALFVVYASPEDSVWGIDQIIKKIKMER